MNLMKTFLTLFIFFLIPKFCFAYTYNCKIEHEIYNQVFIFQINEDPGKYIFKNDKGEHNLFGSETLEYSGMVIQTEPYQQEFKLIVTRFHKKNESNNFEGYFYNLDFYDEPYGYYVKIIPYAKEWEMNFFLWHITAYNELLTGKCK